MNLNKIKGILHLIAIVCSTIASAIVAGGMGGDPVHGAVIGMSTNTVAAAVSAYI